MTPYDSTPAQVAESGGIVPTALNGPDVKCRTHGLLYCVECKPGAGSYVEPLALSGYAEKQLDAVDASVFNGDCYGSAAGRARLRWYMARWSRRLDEDEAAEAADDDDDEYYDDTQDLMDRDMGASS